VLGIIGSIIGGAVTHMFSRPKNERSHPAALVFSILGAILVLFICYKLKIHFPQVELIERQARILMGRSRRGLIGVIGLSFSCPLPP
jgi:uncharacterized membrane protein